MILGAASFSVQPTHTKPDNDSYFLSFRDNSVLLSGSADAPAIPTWAQVSMLVPPSFEPFELARTDQREVFSHHPFDEKALPEGNGLHYLTIGSFRQMSSETASILTSAWHLWSWYDHNRFCGHCGKPLTPDTRERALRCAACGQMLFPTIAPAIIVAITCGDRILLARNAHSTFQHYSLIAGYVEVGETLEHAVHREVMEEVGLKVKAVEYIGDQPWGLSGSQMFAFHAKADADASITLQQSELSEAKWFSRDELTPSQHRHSVAFELIERFRTGRL